MRILLNIIFRRARGQSKLKYKRLKRRLMRLKNKKYPKRPLSNEQARDMLKLPDIATEYGRTLDKHDRFYTDTIVTPNHAFHMFVSYTTVEFIKNNIPPNERFYLMDGTFKIIPRNFNQVLVIAIEYQNDVSNGRSSVLGSLHPFSTLLLL